MEKLQHFLATFQNLIPVIVKYGLTALTAILILIIGWIIAGWFSRATTRRLNKFKSIDPSVSGIIASLVRYTIIIFTLVLVLAQFGVQTASIVTMLGAAGLAIGLALQGTLQNVASGLMILFLRPFHIGDYIEAGDTSGTVKRIHLFLTELTTVDGIAVLVPNSLLWGSRIKNYAKNPTRRIDLVVGIAYDNDVQAAMTLLYQYMEADKRTLNTPEAMAFISNLGESSVDLTMRAWVTKQDYWPTLFQWRKDAKLKLETNGFSIPFPQRDVHHYSDGVPMVALPTDQDKGETQGQPTAPKK